MIVPSLQDLEAGALVGSHIVALVEFAVGKALPAVGHAAHLKAFELPGLEALADGEFRAAASYVDHEARAPVVGERVRHAQIDEARLLAAVNDLDGGAEDASRGFREVAPVAGAAQGVGADDAQALRGDAVEHLGKAPQAVKARVDRALG